jgi:hypothetical protein
MDGEFNAERFLDQLNSGNLDGRLSESIGSLTAEELEQVALLMAKRLRESDSL